MNVRTRDLLEGAMPKPYSFLKQAMPLVYAIVAVPAFVVVLLLLFDGANRFGLLGGPVCVSEDRGRTTGLSGFDFDISETSCFFDPAVSVFISKAGEQKKTLLFKYFPLYIGPYPTITSIGEHAVQISVSRVSSLFCRRDKWDDLTVKYDIGTVEYPSVQAQLPEC
jgi:hypothetical protein